MFCNVVKVEGMMFFVLDVSKYFTQAFCDLIVILCPFRITFMKVIIWSPFMIKFMIVTSSFHKWRPYSVDSRYFITSCLQFLPNISSWCNAGIMHFQYPHWWNWKFLYLKARSTRYCSSIVVVIPWVAIMGACLFLYIPWCLGKMHLFMSLDLIHSDR